MDVKPFWKSRTIWANVLAFAAAVILAQTGQDFLSEEIQLGILAALNLVLRFQTDSAIGK